MVYGNKEMFVEKRRIIFKENEEFLIPEYYYRNMELCIRELWNDGMMELRNYIIMELWNYRIIE